MLKDSSIKCFDLYTFGPDMDRPGCPGMPCCPGIPRSPWKCLQKPLIFIFAKICAENILLC